jgi:hypothetical protein
MLELSVINNLRPADAWWRRAIGIVEGSQPVASCRMDGRPGTDWVNPAIVFEKGFAAAKTHREQMDVTDRNRGIWMAKSIYEQRTPNGQALRWAIEARILARQTNEQIAQCTGCTPAGIAAFIIGPPAAQAKDEPIGRLWKLFGYRAGPYVLEAVMGGPAGRAACGQPG